jgi:electron transfer flavoprotein alpha/beta subunit
MVMVPLALTITVYAAGMVTVIVFGIVTLSDGPGIVPPHVAESFQFPLATAVNEAA